MAGRKWRQENGGKKNGGKVPVDEGGNLQLRVTLVPMWRSVACLAEGSWRWLLRKRPPLAVVVPVSSCTCLALRGRMPTGRQKEAARGIVCDRGHAFFFFLLPRALSLRCVGWVCAVEKCAATVFHGKGGTVISFRPLPGGSFC